MTLINTAPVFHEASPVGKARIDFSHDGINTNDIGESLTVLSSGKILVAGYSTSGGTSDFSIARLNADGTLDTTFSSDGKAIFDILGYSDYGVSMTVQTDGKVLVAGHSYTYNSNIGLANLSLIRLNTNGTLDTSFGTGGKASFEVGTHDDFGKSVTVLSDNKILVSGFKTNADGTTSDFSVIRLTANGLLDSTFGTSGKTIIDIGAYDQGHTLTVSGDKILISGFSASATNSDFSLIRLNANGMLDTSFNGGGKVSFDLGGYDVGSSLAVQADGKIVIAGTSTIAGDDKIGLIRLDANGQRDNTFGINGNGTVLVDIGSYDDAGNSVTIHNGKILIAGTSSNGHDNDFSIVRLNADGTLDTTFSLNGKATFDLGGGNDDAGNSVTVQADGKILISGTSFNGSNNDFSLIRLNWDGSLDTSFNSLVSLPQPSTLGSSVDYYTGDDPIKLEASAVIYDAELAALDDSAGNYSGASVTLSRNGGASAQDVFSGVDNLELSGGQAVLSGVIVGTVSNTGGTLTITFNENATQARVNTTLSSIGYVNNANYPPASVQIDWVFSDGNSAGALTATGSTTVYVTGNASPVVINGATIQKETLTADISALELTPSEIASLSYQWQADEVDISGQTGNSLTLTQDQVDKAITLVVNYTDSQNVAQNFSSNASAFVENVNDAPTGSVTITGTTTQGQTLTAANTLADIDGLGVISYQWEADGVAISGATGSTLVLGQAQVGKAITVVASYTDAYNTAESKTSVASAPVVNVNDAPTGKVTITGTAKQGQTLTVSNTLADLDGLGTISYQWKAGGVAISGATGSTLVLGQDQVGKAITVVASYTDGFNKLENKTSAASAAVENVNDAPTGSVTLSGTVTQGQTLTAANTLADIDGLGTISYQWKAGGVAISGATASTLVLGQAQVGKAITVTASYTDGQGTLESVTSSASAAVTNVNDAPTGSVSITGTATQGQTLTAANTLADLDGLGTISYQWKAGGVTISGVTGSTLVLGQDQVGKAITVTARYTDGFGKLESKTSAASAPVANVNDTPTGSVTFSGTAALGQTLTATNTLADIDGLGTIGYQWKADGVAISGATASTLVLGQDQIGKSITVTASYTDGQGTLESVTSSASAAVSTDTTAPTVALFSPADEAIGVAPSSNIVLTFSEAVVKGSGNIVLKTAAGTVIATYDVATSANLTLSADSTTLTINPGSDLAFSTAYKVELAAGTFKDLVGNSYAGSTSYNFSTIGTTYTGTANAEKLTGGVGNDTLNGLEGNDTLDGGAGIDTMTGGDGSDSYHVDNIGDRVIETNATASTGGTDMVYSYLSGYTLGDHVENGRIMATSTANLTGNGLDNTLYAGAGNNVLNGSFGLDTVSYQYAGAAVTVSLATTAAQATGGSGSDSLRFIENLTGSSYNDNLTGSAINNTLNGGAGADTMTGGDGSDTYHVDNIGDRVIETNATVSTGGTDLVLSYLSAYTLGDNVENGRIMATGTANLTGNSLANTLYAGAGNNVLNGSYGLDTASYEYASAAVQVNLNTTTAQATGGSGSDTLRFIENLTGSSYNDSLTGTSLNNVLNGGAGADTMTGGGGRDTYHVDNAGDVVIETSTGGIDVVYSYLSAYTLHDNVENGRILTTGTASLTGNSLDNILYAGTGDNALDGSYGVDTVSYQYASAAIQVSLGITAAQATGGSGGHSLRYIENLTGSSYNDNLTGNAGSNVLNGGAGADTMSGGGGNDIYYVDNAGDKVIEGSASGTDTVYSALGSYTLGDNVENGRILISSTASLTGNSLANTLYAGRGNNVLDGSNGVDTASYEYAKAAVQVSLATTAAQTTGGSGSDTLLNIENLTGSSYADKLTGNAGSNVLNGGAGNDILNGGAGNDVLIGGLGADRLTGGAGADRFVFNLLTEMGLNSTTWDTITDFKTSEGDKIDLQGVDANTALAGDQAFTFLGAVSAFTGNSTGKLRFDAATQTLYGSTDADTAAEFAIALTGVSSLASTDLVL